MKKKTFLEAAHIVLCEADGSMSTRDIIKEVLGRKLWERKGRPDTEYNSLYGTLIKAVKAGDKRIGRVKNGDQFYAFKENIEETSFLEKEGRVVQVVENRYERNPKARKICVEHYGTKCSACGFNFEEFYGKIGNGYIHVHHIIPLSERKAEYVIDPINDLIPVCPNCHAMLHIKKTVMSITDLARLINPKDK